MPELTVADRIRRLDPCPPAMAWAAGYTNPALAWAECQDGSWMLWLIGRCAGGPESPARRQLVLAACDCAALALPQARDACVGSCIDTARRWARGEAFIEELRAAAEAVVAEAAAEAAAWATAWAARSAARSAWATNAAWAAAEAAEAAAWATEAAYAAGAAQAATLAQCADIVRRHYPTPPTLQA